MKANWVNIRTGLIIGFAVLIAISFAWLFGVYRHDPELVYHGNVIAILPINRSAIFLIPDNKTINANSDIRVFKNGTITKLTDYDIWFGNIKQISGFVSSDYYIYKVYPSNDTAYYLLSPVAILTWKDTEGWSKLNPRKNIVPQSW